MHQMTRYVWFDLLVLLLLGLRCAAWAQAAPEDTLLLKAQQAIGDKKPDEVIATLERLRQQYPAADATAKSDVILYGLYLDKDDIAHAGVIGNDVCTRWPRTEAAWSIIAANCEYKAKHSSAEALAALEKAARQDILPPTAHYRAIALHLKYLQTAKPDDFLAEGMKAMARIPAVTDKDDLIPMADMAARLYGPLMVAKRFDDAKSICDELQEKLALLGDPGTLASSDNAAYLSALAANDQARYLIVLHRAINYIAMATTEQEIKEALTVAKQGYPALMQAKLFDDAKSMHAKMQQALAQQPNKQAQRKTDIGNYLTALKAADKAQYDATVQASIQSTTAAQTADDLFEPLWIACSGYQGLCDANRLTDAKANHQLMLTALQRVNAPHAMQFDELCAYATALQTTRDTSYLPETVPYIQAIDTANSTEVYFLGAMADERYMTDNKIPLNDVFTLFDKVDAALAKMKQDGMRKSNYGRMVWLLQWGKGLDEQVVADHAVAYGKTLTATASHDQFRLATMLAARAYATLLHNDKFDDAAVLHTQLQSCLEKQADKTLTSFENDSYYSSIAQAKPAKFLPFITALVEKMATLTDTNEIQSTATAIGAGYAIIMQAKSIDVAGGMHEKVQAGLLRGNLPQAQQADTIAFLTALAAADPAQFVLQARPLVQGIATATGEADISGDANLAALLYLPMAQKDAVADVRVMHQSVQAALKRIKLSTQIISDDYAYFSALLKASPSEYISDALPRAQAVTTATTADDVKLALGYAQNLYAPMMKMGRFDEVKTLHDQVQGALAKFTLKDESAADALKYKGSMSIDALEAMLSLYKRAVANDDKAGAKKWFDQLNAVAPESQEAGQARAINRALTPDK